MRVRFRYSVLGKIRFLGHRDVARAWERALRRSGSPVAYSEGFTPRPRLHFGPALSVGHESLAEYLDVDFAAPVEVDSLAGSLGGLLPQGLDVMGAAVVDRAAGSLQSTIEVCSWSLVVSEVDADALGARAAELMAMSELPMRVIRKGEPVDWDVRPVLRALHVTAERGAARLDAELATAPRGIRIPELVAAFSPLEFTARVTRLHQWMTIDGRRTEPVPVPAVVDGAERRAS